MEKAGGCCQLLPKLVGFRLALRLAGTTVNPGCRCASSHSLETGTQIDGRQSSDFMTELTFSGGRHRFLRHLKLLYELRSSNHPLSSRPLFLLRVHHE